MQIELSDTAVLALGTLAHDTWTKTYDSFKHVKGMTWEASWKFCPKDEWPLYHASMLEECQKELDKWAGIKKELASAFSVPFSSTTGA